MPKAIRRGVDRFPFVVVIPQCRKKDWWTSSAMEAQALKALDQTMKEFKRDPQRIYLTGLSIGGTALGGLPPSILVNLRPSRPCAVASTHFMLPKFPITMMWTIPRTLTLPPPRKSARPPCGFSMATPMR